MESVLNKLNVIVAKFRNKAYLFLRWTEKWTKTDMVYLSKGGFWLTLNQFINSGLSFLLVIAFANLATKEEYGTYKYVLTLFELLSITTLRGINLPTAQSVAQGKERVVIDALKKKIRWGFLGLFGALIISLYYLLFGDQKLSILILSVALLVPFKDSFSIYSSFLNGKKYFKNLAICNSITSILNGALILCILFARLDVAWVIAMPLLLQTTINLYYYVTTLKKYKPNQITDKKSISYGRDLSIVNLFTTGAGYLDKVLSFNVLGPIGMALYAIALAPISQINGLFGNINTLATPKLSQLDTTTLRNGLRIKEKRILLISSLIAVTYVLLANLLFNLFFPQYIEAVPYTRLLAITIPLTLLSRFRITALQTRFDKKKILFFTISLALVEIILYGLLIYLYGLIGLIFAYILISIYQYIISGVLIKKIK